MLPPAMSMGLPKSIGFISGLGFVWGLAFVMGCQFDEGGYNPAGTDFAVANTMHPGEGLVGEAGLADGPALDARLDGHTADQSVDTKATDSTLDGQSPDTKVDTTAPPDTVKPDTVAHDTTLDSPPIPPDSTSDTVKPCLATDEDGDTIMDGCDNCESVYNPSQTDMDNDKVGDACDPDLDGDGIANESGDNNLDGDLEDNDVDADDDNDGVPDVRDPNSLVFQEARFAKLATDNFFATDMDTTATWGLVPGLGTCSADGALLAFALLKSSVLPATVTDYMAETSFTFNTQGIDVSGGLFFRAEDTVSGQSGYLCSLRRETAAMTWSLVLSAHQDGSTLPSKEEKSATPFILPVDATIRLRIIAKGDSLKCLMVSPVPNAQPEELNPTWSNYASGSVGLWSDKGRACFDYLTVVDAL